MTNQQSGRRASSTATSINLNEFAPAPAEHKEIAGVRIALQRSLHLQGWAIRSKKSGDFPTGSICASTGMKLRCYLWTIPRTSFHCAISSPKWNAPEAAGLPSMHPFSNAVWAVALPGSVEALGVS